MLPFFIAFLLSWLAGISLGALHLTSIPIICCIAATALFLWYQNFKLQIVVTAIFLLLLGYLWGLDSNRNLTLTCNNLSPQSGTIIAIDQIRPSQTRYIVKLDSCLCLITLSHYARVSIGDTINLSGGKLQNLAQITDFSKGYASYLSRRGIGGSWYFPEVEVYKAVASRTHFVSYQVQKLHTHLNQRIQKLFIEPDASLISGMLLAERGFIPENIVTNFRATGVSHILAISGLHITIIAGIIITILNFFPLHPRPRTVLSIMLLWLYVIFIGAPISTIRAASFLSIAMIFMRLGRLTNLPMALLLTVTILMSINPQIIYEISFQLSVSAVAGIYLTLFLVKPYLNRLKSKLFKWMLSLILVSTGAFLGTWPLITLTFGNISLLSIPTNLLVVPVVPFIITLAIFAVAVSFILPLIAIVTSYFVHFLISWINFITAILSSLPGTHIEQITLSAWFIMVYYFSFAFLTFIIIRFQQRSWREFWA